MSKIIDRQISKHFKGKGHFNRDTLSSFLTDLDPEITERCKYVRKSNRLPDAEDTSVAGGSNKQGTADRLAD